MCLLLLKGLGTSNLYLNNAGDFCLGGATESLSAPAQYESQVKPENVWLELVV